VGTFTHPQSNIRDFYHELGDLFDIPAYTCRSTAKIKAAKSMTTSWEVNAGEK